MMKRLFSQRHGLDNPNTGPRYECAPEEIRDGLIWVLNIVCDRLASQPEFIDSVHDRTGLKAYLWNRIAYLLDHKYRRGLRREDLILLIRSVDWYEFYDICELLHDAFMRIDRERNVTIPADIETFKEKIGERFSKEGIHRLPLYVDEYQSSLDFSNELNRVLSDHQIGYKLKDGEIQRILPAAIQETIDQTTKLLHHSEFAGPEQQFQKAIRFYNQRPKPDLENPDLENTVKEAVGAVEATLRILANDEKLTLSQIIKQEPFNTEIHGALKRALDSMYGYRGDAPGVAHGQAGPSVTGTEEAELVLAQSAGWIVYLYNKFANT